MKKGSRRAAVKASLLLVLAFAVVSCGGESGEGGGPITATMAGASPTGHFRVVGETMNNLIRQDYPGSSIAYEPGSPVGSLAKVANGQAQLALSVSPIEDKLATEGEPPFEEPLDGKYLGIMQLHEQQLITAVMLESFAEEYGIENYADIAEKKPPVRIVLNQTGNIQSTIVPEDIFAEYGFTLEDIESWGGRIERGSSGDGAALLRDRQVDIWINPIFVPIGTIEEVVAAGVPLRWIEADEEHLQPVAEKWGLSTATIEAGAYDFVAEDQPTIRYPTYVVASPDMPEEQVYRILKALYDHTEEMQRIHPSMSDPEFGFSLENGAKVADAIPLHPGAQRYYEEAGAL